MQNELHRDRAGVPFPNVFLNEVFDESSGRIRARHGDGDDALIDSSESLFHQIVLSDDFRQRRSKEERRHGNAIQHVLRHASQQRATNETVASASHDDQSRGFD